MLILSRRVGEVIRINDDISVTVLGVNGMQVRLGIVAPQGVAVHRQEIYERIQAGQPRPAPSTGAGPDRSEPLHGNRTEAEWRQLLADEAEEQAAWDKQMAKQPEVQHGT